MAILKHVHKSKRHEHRAGCTTPADVHRLMSYLLRDSAHGGIVHNDFESTTAVGIADELVALDRGRTKYLAYHFMFSFPEKETKEWQTHLDALLLDFKERFGIFKLVAAEHRDKDHYHVHIAVFAQTERGHKLRLETHQDGQPSVPERPPAFSTVGRRTRQAAAQRQDIPRPPAHLAPTLRSPFWCAP